jgi:hypothetical protein
MKSIAGKNKVVFLQPIYELAASSATVRLRAEKFEK